MENNIASSLGIVPTIKTAAAKTAQPEAAGKPEPSGHFQAGRREMTGRERRRYRAAERSKRHAKQQKGALKRRQEQTTRVADAANIGRIYFTLVPARDETRRRIVERIDRQVQNIVDTEDGVTRGDALERVESSLRSAIQLDDLRRQQETSSKVKRQAEIYKAGASQHTMEPSYDRDFLVEATEVEGRKYGDVEKMAVDESRRYRVSGLRNEGREESRYEIVATSDRGLAQAKVIEAMNAKVSDVRVWDVQLGKEISL